MRRRNDISVLACEVLELRLCPSSASLGSDGFLTIMGSSPQSVIHVTQYDHQMVVQVDANTPLIFDKDAVRYLAGFAPDGEYFASLEIVFLPSVAGDISLAESYASATTLSSDSSDDIPAIATDLPIVIDDDDLISGFGDSITEDDLPMIELEDESASVDVGVAVFEDTSPHDESADTEFEIALIEIFSNQNDFLVDASI